MDFPTPIPPLPLNQVISQKKVSKLLIGIVVAVLVVILLFVAGFFFSMPPKSFVVGDIVTVPKATTLSKVADMLDERGLIRSKDMFKIAALMVGGRNGAMSGDYLFDTPESVWTIAYRITHAQQGIARVKVTFPEGFTVKEIGATLVKAIPTFDEKGFLDAASTSEGYLFPDTYYFFGNVDPAEVVRVLRSEFDRKYASVRSDPAIMTGSVYGRSKKDIVTMASIVEKEAVEQTDREMVAGILWKRLDKGMLLQVDPPFQYFLGKTTFDLTFDDLKVDSPYNTYLHKGLPPTPIDNPGVDALRATMQAKSSPYWFYLSDKKGGMHYARTYDEHLTNRRLYLGK